MNLDAWAIKHGISAIALNDLKQNFGIAEREIKANETSGSESRQQALIQMFAASKGWKLWRNNVGALKTDTGRIVRYGLANDTPALNKKIKSSDLIGCRPILITPGYIGQTIGQFVSVECKHESWQFSGSDHESAQFNWLKLMAKFGAYGTFATTPEDLE